MALKAIILMPVFNDWESACLLWRHLDRVFTSVQDIDVAILCVDDGSTAPFDERNLISDFRKLSAIHVLRLRRNVGHQRALAIGLTHIYQNSRCDAVICMDADGEDSAEGCLALLEVFQSRHSRFAVFAARRKRMENRVFQIGYSLFRFGHLFLVGFPVRIGNFSILPVEQLSALVVSPDLWSHYAATVVKLRLPMTTIPLDRATRLAGHSRMNYVGLISHGLSAISVFSETVATRMLMGGAALVLVISIFCAALVAWRTKVVETPMDWVNILLVIFFLVVANAWIATLFSALGILSRRDQLGFLPIRDAEYFVRDVLPIYEPRRVHL